MCGEISAYIVANSIRPRPQDQEEVLKVVRKAIDDIKA
jgi:hypothetical protein